MLHERFETILAALEAACIETTLSPVLKTPQELQCGSPLCLDITEEVLTPHDPDGVLQRDLDGPRAPSGARRMPDPEGDGY